MRPAIVGQKRLQDWWSLIIKPTLDTVGQKRETVEDVKEFLLSILVYDAEEDSNGEKKKLSELFARRILSVYLSRMKVLSSETKFVSPEDEFVANDIQEILVAFGRKNPKVRVFDSTH